MPPFAALRADFFGYFQNFLTEIFVWHFKPRHCQLWAARVASKEATAISCHLFKHLKIHGWFPNGKAWHLSWHDLYLCLIWRRASFFDLVPLQQCVDWPDWIFGHLTRLQNLRARNLNTFRFGPCSLLRQKWTLCRIFVFFSIVLVDTASYLPLELVRLEYLKQVKSGEITGGNCWKEWSCAFLALKIPPPLWPKEPLFMGVEKKRWVVHSVWCGFIEVT